MSRRPRRQQRRRQPRPPHWRRTLRVRSARLWKKLLSILALVLFVAGIANATTPWNDPAKADAKFKCNVIKPLTVEDPQDITISEVCIAGQTKVFETPYEMKFVFHGEGTYAIDIIYTDPDNTGSVDLNGSWTSQPTALVAGTATATYTATGISSASVLDWGLYEFTVGVSADYTAL